MKFKAIKGNLEICIVDTDNKKQPIKFNDKHLPAWKDVKIIEIKSKKQEVSDGDIK